MELKFESNTINLDIANANNLITSDIDGYDIANTRMETRHIIQQGSVNILHPKMSDDEYFDFMFLSDTLINYLVRTRFGLEPNILEIK